MKTRNLPSLDGCYWAAIFVASLLGTTFGDFVSNDLGLGFAGALLPLGAILAVIFVAEQRARRANVAYYWAAIVITRTAATNFGDLLARTLHLGYGWVSAVLVLLLAIFLVVSRRGESRSAEPDPDADSARKILPKTDASYWVAMLMVSTLGTTFGDFVSDGLGFGLASLVLGVFLATVLLFEFKVKMANEARYWAVIAVVRTTGTVMGDFLTGEEGLGLGFALGAGLLGALLVAILLLPRILPDAPKITAPAEIGS